MAAKPGEYKTVQVRILAYAQETGWTCPPRRGRESQFRLPEAWFAGTMEGSLPK